MCTPWWGGAAPSAERVTADLVRPANLPTSAVLSCTPLGRGHAVVAAADSGGNCEEAGAEGGAVPDMPAPARSPASSVAACVSFKVVLTSGEAARQLMFTKRAHRQLGTGIVVRQALTARERAVQAAFMPQYRDLRAAGEAVDFRRGRLYRRLNGKWVAMALPECVRGSSA